MTDLRVNEVFHSIQGESTHAGLPCVFVRLTGCPLRCVYCDTEYAFRQGATRSISDLVEEVLAHGTPLVELTGGEPLAQAGVHEFMTRLLDAGRTVLVETSGAMDISACDPRVIRVLDLKTPGSGEADRNLLANLDDLRPQDEVKFVITSRADYEWARDLAIGHDLAARCAAVLLSPVFEQARGAEVAGCPALAPRDLAEWMLADCMTARLQLQTHKFIWDPSTRGV